MTFVVICEDTCLALVIILDQFSRSLCACRLTICYIQVLFTCILAALHMMYMQEELP